MIDAHVHVWSLDAKRYPWQPTLAHVPVPDSPAEAATLIAEMDGSGVSHTILVQPSVYGWNNAYMCDSLRRWPSRFTGVCLVDPRSAEAADQLAYWTLEQGCRGVRVNLIGDPDAGWALDPSRRPLWEKADSLRIPVSLQIRPAHAPVVAGLAPAFPRTIFFVDYMGPDVFHDGSGIEALDTLRALDNVWYKILSVGMDSRKPYPFEDLWPLYSHAMRTFGASRLVFGTDFPHIYRTSTYAEGIGWLEELPFLDAAARRAIGDGNARQLWAIPA